MGSTPHGMFSNLQSEKTRRSIGARTVFTQQTLNTQRIPSMSRTRLLPNSSSLFSSLEDAKDDEIYNTALTNTFITVIGSSVIGLLIWFYQGAIPCEQFFASYLVEQALSLDNLFVFLLLFKYFEVPLEYQSRVLNWGFYGAIVMRFIMISLGIAAIKSFRPVLVLFAGILVYSSGKMLVDMAGDEEEEEDMSDNAIVKFSKNLFPTTDKFDGDRFFSQVNGVQSATPMLLCMIAVELSDLVFAVDSIPAVFGVTLDPFIVFVSNICAISGLRSLYVVLSEAASNLKYLEPAVAVVLLFIGIKLLLEYVGIDISTTVSLCVVGALLSSGIGLSVLTQEKETP